MSQKFNTVVDINKMGMGAEELVTRIPKIDNKKFYKITSTKMGDKAGCWVCDVLNVSEKVLW